MSDTNRMSTDLDTRLRPGGVVARRQRMAQAWARLERAHDNGWPWHEILIMARELLEEPNLTLGAFYKRRYRYKRLLAKQPELAASTPSPVPATPLIAPAQNSGESAVARARRLQQQDKAQIEAQITAPQQQQPPATTPNAPAAPLSLSGKRPRTVARKVEEIAQALEADSDMLKYPVMGAEEAMALAQDLENRGMLKLAAREFAQYCFDRIFPIYESMDNPLIRMRTDVGRWEPVVANFARARRPYGEFILTLVHRINPKATIEGKGFSGTAANQIMTLIREKNS